MKKRNGWHILKLFTSTVAVGFICAILVFLFKQATEQIEHILFAKTRDHYFLSFLFPAIGLSTIYLLRKYLFQGKDNKGIREINEGLHLKDPYIPFYKIPSHLINGFATITFGGSTGIEVSSVVASSAIGSAINTKMAILKKYRSEIICAGAAAAITALFNSPLAGIFFAYEVMYKRSSKYFLVLTLISVSVAFIINLCLHQEPLFQANVETWHTYAIPYFIVLGVIAGFNSVYLTRIVIYLKKLLGSISHKYLGMLLGSLLIGTAIYFFPALYGEGYNPIQQLLLSEQPLSSLSVILQLLLILLLKPILTSLTLASGGDGGVFAPSLFIGAFLGLFISLVLNTYFNAQVIPVNFIIVGMASVLCASIQAPLTSIFLVCGITGNYVLLIPLAIGCAMSRITAYLVYPYSVYNYPIK